VRADFTPQRNPAITVEDWTQRWLAEQGVRGDPATAVVRRNFVRSRILPFIGQKLIDEVDATDLALILQHSASSGLAVNTQRQHFYFMNAIFRDARQARFIAVNPCAGLKLPPRQQVEPFRWSLETIRAQIQAAPRPEMEHIMMLAAGSALRPIEMYRGRVEDYDARGHWLRVTYRSRYAITPRRIALPRLAADAIESLIEAAHTKRSPFIVSRRDGLPHDRESFNRMFSESLVGAHAPPSRRYSELRLAFGFLARLAEIKETVIDYYTKMRTGRPAPPDNELRLAALQIDSVIETVLAKATTNCESKTTDLRAKLLSPV